jgi:hypothetical protein
MCGWLGRQKMIKTINRTGTSYGLKHVAERDIGYLTNGIFIAAAHACGYRVVRVGDSPNAWLNISQAAWGSPINGLGQHWNGYRWVSPKANREQYRAMALMALLLPRAPATGGVERDLIRTRTAEGRSRAKVQGQHMGRRRS